MHARCARTFCFALITMMPLFSQTSGEITGVVTDSSGSVIVGASVAVTNPQTNFTRNTLSNTTGNYTFPSLPPGLYDVRVEMQGFQSAVRTGIQLQVQQTARIDFRVDVGAITETVEVSGGAPILNTENATVGTVIEQKRILDLPLNGRSFVSLIALSPNVTSGNVSTGSFASVRGGGTGRGDVSISIAGMRREYNYYTLDGVSNTDVDFNTYAFLPSIDALQEFKVQTGVYSAEFGRQAAQVNVLTRSGTNSYHGTAFEFLRNNALDARPYAFTSSVPKKAPFRWNQYGFMLGGPVRIPGLIDGTNRLFFMSNYEAFRLRSQGQQVFSVAPGPMRNGNFSQLLPNTVVFDPENNDQPFPGNIIPTSRFHPIAIGLLEFFPEPNVAGTGFVNNYLALQNNTSDKDQFTQRIDFVESGASSWFGRYSWQDEKNFSPALYQNGFIGSANVKQAMLSNTRVLSPSLVNEFRFGWLNYNANLLNENAFKRNVMAELGIPFLNPPPAGWGTTQIVIPGFSRFGDDLQGPFVANNHTFQWIDNLTWIHGNHTMKFGAEIRRDRYNVFGNQTTRGQYLMGNQATGYGFSDFMLGYVNRSAITGLLAVSQLRSTAQYYYVTDSWKLLPNLSIEMGVRYEYAAPWNSKGDSMANVVIPQLSFTPNDPGEHPYFGRMCSAYGQTEFTPPGSLVRFNPAIGTRCVDNYDSTTLVNRDTNNFAPRLGIAWSPTSTTTVRAGIGVFYTQDENNHIFNASRNIAAPQVVVGANLDTHDLRLDKPFPPDVGAACGVDLPLICISAPVSFTTDPSGRTSYLTQYELNIQQQLTDSTVLEIGYLGSQGHALRAKITYNNAVPGPGSFADRFPWPEFFNLENILAVAASNYHSGSIKLTHRLTNGLSFLAGYTLSKSLDNSNGVNPTNGTVGGLRQPQTGWCVPCEYGRSEFDTRQRFVGSVLYELPVGRGKPYLNSGVGAAVLGGWQLNSIFTISTGFPLTILDGINRSNSNASSDRPNAVPGATWKLDNPTPSQWFNIRAFQLQPQYTYGNVGRATATSPGFVAWDFSTLKNFSFTETVNLQFRFECFNCANHPAFGDPLTTMSANQLDAQGIAIPGSGAFGQITNTRIDMRKLQFSLKFLF